jgi:hypothetical protein
MRWPIAITVAGVVVVAVNFAYIWIAVNADDPVVSTYETEAR